jgi:hypothetical protein
MILLSLKKHIIFLVYVLYVLRNLCFLYVDFKCFDILRMSILQIHYKSLSPYNRLYVQVQVYLTKRVFLLNMLTHKQILKSNANNR